MFLVISDFVAEVIDEYRLLILLRGAIGQILLVCATAIR